MRDNVGPAGVTRVYLRVIASIFATFIPLFSVIPSSSQAAVSTSITSTAGTGDLGTTITHAGNLYNITGGTRPGGGPNLFHSFGSFGIGAGDIANFLNTPVNGSLPITSNILGRVTDGNISNIFGTIQTTGFGNANLFLMNPNGFLFGPNAALNVGGMVAFTTADYLRLHDGTNNGYFYADPAGPSLLTAAPITAFGFLGPNAASIAIQGGTLEVPEGKTLSFIGGPRSFTTDTGATVPSGVTMAGGSLSAPNGLIYMGTVTSPGEVPVPTLSGAPLGTLGSPSLDSAVIRIRSGEFVMDHAFLTATNTGDATQPPIDVSIQGIMVVRNASSISSQNLGAGHGSDVHIAAQSLLMDGSSIMSTIVGSGQGGAVSITVTDTASLTNNSTIKTSSASPNGNASPIGINASHVILQDSAISAEYGGDGTTAGNGGAVTLMGTDSVAMTRSKIATDTFASNGNGGAVSITAPTVTLEGSSTVINTIFTGAAGDGITPVAGSGGVVTLTVTTGPLSVTNSSISTASNSAGSAGAVSLTGNSSLTLADSSIDSSTVLAIGDSGPVTVTTTGPLSMTNSTINTSSFFAGPGGAVSLTGGDSLTATNLSIDASTAFSVGDSGPVTFTTNGPLSMTNSHILTSAIQSGNAGAVTATGGNVTLGGTTVTAEVFGDATVGLNMVQSGAVTLSATDPATGTVIVTNGSSISTQGFNTDLDNSPVTITGKTINILNGSAIDASMHNGNGDFIRSANGGTIEIRGRTVNVAGSQLLSFGDGASLSTGTGGNIHFVGSNDIQTADNIQLTASQVITNATAGGGGGIIEFQTKALTLSNTQIGAATFGPGPGGSITVRGAENITLDSGSAMNTSAINSGFQGPFGAAGSILLETQQLTMQGGSVLTTGDLPLSRGDGGTITVRGTNGPGQSILIDGAGTGIFTDAEGTGAGGSISMNASSVTLQNGGTLSAKTSGTEATAIGGTISVTATNQVTMTGGASITASSTGPGNAGNIHINAGQQLEMQNSSIKTEAAHASGGNIDIQAVNRVRLVNSTISTSVLGGSGSGGNISIDPNVVVLQNSQVIAQAVQGAGGNITITTPLFLADQTSLVSASSQFGLNGTVTIQNPTSNLSESLGPLPSSMLEQQALQAQRCAALHGGGSSSFVIAGRDTVPTEPGGWLASSLGLHSLGHGLLADTIIDEHPPATLVMTEASESISLRRLTPIGFLTQRFAGNGSDGCRS